MPLLMPTQSQALASSLPPLEINGSDSFLAPEAPVSMTSAGSHNMLPVPPEEPVGWSMETVAVRSLGSSRTPGGLCSFVVMQGTGPLGEALFGSQLSSVPEG